MDMHTVTTRESNNTLLPQNNIICRMRHAILRLLSFVFHILLACLCRWVLTHGADGQTALWRQHCTEQSCGGGKFLCLIGTSASTKSYMPTLQSVVI